MKGADANQDRVSGSSDGAIGPTAAEDLKKNESGEKLGFFFPKGSLG